MPTAQTIAALARTFAPDTRVRLDLVYTVATGICATVTNSTVAYASSSELRRSGPYRGVPIGGQQLSTGG